MRLRNGQGIGPDARHEDSRQTRANRKSRCRLRNTGSGFPQGFKPRPRGPGEASVEATALGHVAADATQVALDRGGRLALALLGRLLVELALAGLGEDAGLLAGALEATQGKLERLVFADFDAGHGISGADSVGPRDSCPRD